MSTYWKASNPSRPMIPKDASQHMSASNASQSFKHRSTKSKLGENPNAAVEDEYIHNLQQQVQFMELEAKLLKEREKEREALTGIELTDDKVVQEHMIQMKVKFEDMKEMQSKTLTKLSKQQKDAEKQCNIQERSKLELQNDRDELKYKLIDENNKAKIEREQNRKNIDHTINAMDTEKNKCDRNQLEQTKSRKENTSLCITYMFKRKQDEYDNKSAQDKIGFFNELILEQRHLIDNLETEKNDLSNQLYNSEEILAIQKQSNKIMEDMYLAACERDKLEIECKHAEYFNDLLNKKLTESDEVQHQHECAIKEYNQLLETEDLRYETCREANEKNFTSEDVDEIKQRLSYLSKQERETEKNHNNKLKINSDVLDEIVTLQANIKEITNQYLKINSNKDKVEEETKRVNQELEVLHSEQDQLMNNYEESDNKRSDNSKKLKKLEGENIILIKELESLKLQYKQYKDNTVEIEQLKKLQQSNNEFNSNIDNFIGKWQEISKDKTEINKEI